MRVLLIQVDGKMPNLALMKLSAYHKTQGDQVGFNIVDPDIVYISVIYEKNYPQAQGIVSWYPRADCFLGGPGLGVPNQLDEEIEHIMPDYDLYKIDYSLGFTTRGCIRNCPFCAVPRLEGQLREHASIEEFHSPDHNKLVLFDNNILASKLLNQKLDYIKDHALKVCFNQGLDARLITEDMAIQLAEVQSYNLHFTAPTYYFAWDLIENENSVLRGLEKMIEVGVSPRNLMVYMLVGFNTTHEEDYYRFNKLIEIGCDPFVMVYNNQKNDPWIRHFARWVNKRIYKICDISDYERYPLTIEVHVPSLEAN